MKKQLLLFLLPLIFPVFLYADEATLLSPTETFERAKVLYIEKESMEQVPGTGAQKLSQVLHLKILSGDLIGKNIIVRNDLTPLQKDDLLYVRHTIDAQDGTDYFDVAEPDRIGTLTVITIVFLFLLFLFGGWQGVRGLLSLIGSILAIFYILIPGIAYGYNPIIIGVFVSSVIVILGSYITHGFNKTTTSAVFGMIVTILFTGIGAYYSLSFGRITGYSEETSTFLLLNYRGSLDMAALLFSGIIIGLLGVLYDSAIGQAVAVEELVRAGKEYTKKHVFTRAMRIGREHIGALVNTLAIAYVGVALPLLLLVQDSTTGLRFIINSEVFATEIVRILIGSTGLVLAVPITTAIAVNMLHGKILRENNNHIHKH